MANVRTGFEITTVIGDQEFCQAVLQYLAILPIILGLAGTWPFVPGTVTPSE